ncbi:MAG: hypothetical protein D6785_10245, partial [Planctomycetota bacterium]
MKKGFILLICLAFAFLMITGCNKKNSKTTSTTKVDPVKEGKRLVKDKGCLACHTLNGKKLVGPTFKGLYGKKEKVLSNGKEREITVDDAYIKKSIKEPKADIVKGYPPSMVLTS